MTVLKGTFFPVFLSVIGEQKTSHGTRNYRFYWRGNRAIRAETKDPIHASLLPEIQHVNNKAILSKKPPASKTDNNNADNKISCPILGRASQWYIQYSYYWDSDSLYNQLWLFLYSLIFWNKNRYMVDWYHKPKCQPKCLEKRLDYCVQGQGHSEGSKFKLMFVQTVSSKLLSLL